MGDTVYESTMENGETPIPQTNQNIECVNNEENGIRTAICKRPYITSDDNDDDFYQFILGENPIIWAWGDIEDRTGIPLKHGVDNIGKSHKDFIYLDGNINLLCGYAKEYANIDNDTDNIPYITTKDRGMSITTTSEI